MEPKLSVPRHFGIWLAAVRLALPFCAPAAPHFETSLDRRTISLGETATLSLIFTDCPNVGEPQLEPIDGIDYGTSGESTVENIVNGSVSSTTTYTRELRPAHVGTFVIPAMAVDIGGARLASKALALTVTKALAHTESGPAFIRLVPATNTVYLGQTIALDIICCCQNTVRARVTPQLNSRDFTVGNIPANYSQGRTESGGQAYNTYTFRVPLTPTKIGAYALGPATWTVTVGVQQYMPFFGYVMAGGHEQTFSSDTPEIHVLPIPRNGAPPGYNGAVGSFSLAQYEAAPLSVGVGDPITLKVRIAGRGSFDTVRLPTEGPEWREFNTYPPSGKFDSSDPLQMEGSKYFEQVLVPQNAEIKELPAFAFSYFDPAAGAYRTLTHAPLPLQIHATAATPQPTVIASGAPPPEAQPQNQDIVHIKPFPGAVTRPQPPVIERGWFLGLQAVAPLAWAGALFWRKRKDAFERNPRLRRRVAVEQFVRQGLAALDGMALANDADNFYSTVLRLLQEQLGERLDMPAPGITEAVAQDVKDLDASAQERLRELFQACDQYRYTPEHTSQELASLIPKVKESLADLQKIRPGGRLAATAALIFLALTFSAHAAGITEDFTQANRLYEEGKYHQAATAYEELIHQDHISAAIFFNAGNAWFKDGQIGRAIYNYRRAANLSPRDPDIEANLDIARTKAATSRASMQTSLWARWIGRLTLNEWTAAAGCCVALFFLILAARQVWPEFARNAGGLTWAMAFVSIALIACLGLSVDQHLERQAAVVVVPEAVVRYSPMEEAQSEFTPHDGAELTVLMHNGDWLKVEDGAKRIGWVQRKQVAQIGFD